MPRPSSADARGNDADQPKRRRSHAEADRPQAPRSASCNRKDDASPDDRSQLEAILRLAADGDQRAWRVLIDTYSGRVFGLIRAQCGSSDLAEEITQSTFCTVVAKIGSYTELGKFEQWLFRIAMNRLRDEMRRRKRQARPVEDEALTALAGHEPLAGGPRIGNAGASPSQPLEPLHAGRPELRALRIAMTQLSEADQHIIHLRHNAGLSFKQIAEVLEQPLGTVLARQHRALKKLGELLKGALGRDHPLLRGGEADETSPQPHHGGLETRGDARQSRESGPPE